MKRKENFDTYFLIREADRGRETEKGEMVQEQSKENHKRQKNWWTVSLIIVYSNWGRKIMKRAKWKSTDHGREKLENWRISCENTQKQKSEKGDKRYSELGGTVRTFMV